MKSSVIRQNESKRSLHSPAAACCGRLAPPRQEAAYYASRARGTRLWVRCFARSSSPGVLSHLLPEQTESFPKQNRGELAQTTPEENCDHHQYIYLKSVKKKEKKMKREWILKIFALFIGQYLFIHTQGDQESRATCGRGSRHPLPNSASPRTLLRLLMWTLQPLHAQSAARSSGTDLKLIINLA